MPSSSARGRTSEEGHADKADAKVTTCDVRFRVVYALDGLFESVVAGSGGEYVPLVQPEA